jgi:hypothetical protein
MFCPSGLRKGNGRAARLDGTPTIALITRIGG